MPSDSHSPRLYPGVMISSTFTDLEQHRAALIRAVKGQGLTDVAMENDSAKAAVDVIDSSLQMVRNASAYVVLIGRKYGQTPVCPNRNPEELSITELEFNEAQRLDRPILLFIMGKHPVLPDQFEKSATKRKKLDAFRERAKKMGPDSEVHRVYATFESLEDFTVKAIHAVAELRRYLDERAAPPAQPTLVAPTASETDPIPKPPTFYPEPSYICSHQFVGRQDQLDALSDWAKSADPNPILLFDAIGGTGKSMLTWEWTTKHATSVGRDWAGRFWYSFYERGAIMADFCRHALAYMTGKPLEEFRKMKTPELGEMLLHHLRARPWLFVLDGLERVLVAYHRIDAAEVPDEEINRPTDQIAHRDPCKAIRPEDDDLLRHFAAAVPSKLIITSRLIPRKLLSAASQPIPGIRRVILPGLRPANAEELLRSCGIEGDSQAIQNYLRSHCDCHPLVTGVLAGLINDYLPERGNFDAWAADPKGGGQLNLADLDLIGKRNHILKAAIESLPEKTRQVLSILALVSEAVDYPTLSALNPHLPRKPEEVGVPHNPKSSWRWEWMSDAEKDQAQHEYQAAIQRRNEYEQAVMAWRQSSEFLAAPRNLASTVHDLERRGLLQYDHQTRRYDLHPVVRGIAVGKLRPEERQGYGQRVVDHFSERAHNPYREAQTLEDLYDGLRIVRMLLKMGRYQQAYDAYNGDLAIALFFNAEAYAEVLSLLRAFFPERWIVIPDTLEKHDALTLAEGAAIALSEVNQPEESLAVYGAALVGRLQRADWEQANTILYNMSKTFHEQNDLAKAERYCQLGLDLAILTGDKTTIFILCRLRFEQLATRAQWESARAMWGTLDPMGRNWPRGRYRPGGAELSYAQFRFWQGDLKERHLAHAEQLARTGKNRRALRELHGLRGEWRLEHGKWELAAESFREAVAMAHAVENSDTKAETQLAFARFQLGQLSDPRREVEQLANGRSPSHRALGELWLAIGDHEQAKKHALEAYEWAWADGEPYVHRYELNKAIALLEKLGLEIPKLDPYDPTKDGRLPWEDELAATIARLRARRGD